MLLSLLGSALSMLAYFLLSRLAGGGARAEGGTDGNRSSNVFMRAAARTKPALRLVMATIKAWLRSEGREQVSGYDSKSNWMLRLDTFRLADVRPFAR